VCFAKLTGEDLEECSYTKEVSPHTRRENVKAKLRAEALSGPEASRRKGSPPKRSSKQMAVEGGEEEGRQSNRKMRTLPSRQNGRQDLLPFGVKGRRGKEIKSRSGGGILDLRQWGRISEIDEIKKEAGRTSFSNGEKA